MSNNNPLIHFEKDQVKGYDVDMFQRATIPAMVFKMHEAAMQHVLKLGVSAKELVDQELGWILREQYFEFFRQPDLGESLTIQTNPTGKQRIFTFRDFNMRDAEDKVVAQASSSWLLMDIGSRKMVMQYPAHIDEMLAASAQFEHLPRPPAMKFKIENPDYERAYQVGFHDLDFNGHLSNFFYFKWMLDTLPSDWLKNNQLSTLQIRFKEECFLDDEVVVRIKKLDDQTYLHLMQKNDRILAEGKTVWK